MALNKKNVENDFIKFADNTSIPWEKLNNSTILITGATGLIGETLIKSLLYAADRKNLNIKITGAVRNKEKAEKLYSDYKDNNNLEFYVGDISKPMDVQADYIIHGASITSSKMFVENPVDTIKTTIDGTVNMLELAVKNRIKSMVYLSTMEIYGTPDNDEKITEDSYDYMNHLNPRSSYPESKKMAECLCVSYNKQYNVPVKIARLTQTFGPGIDYNDGRVFAEFARCIIEKRDIVLHTKGETKRNYLYTFDAAEAILLILLNGEEAQAYNAANEETYCSIAEMAEMAAALDKTNSVKVRIEIEDEDKFGYAPVLKMNLDTKKLKALGFKGNTSLRTMFTRMIDSLDKEK